MDISFADRKLARLAHDPAKCSREMGPIRAKKFQMRLEDLRSAQTLEDVRHLPGHYHELAADRKGQWSCDLDQPYRLIFEPQEKPTPTDASGKTLWVCITAVEVIEIANYHGK